MNISFCFSLRSDGLLLKPDTCVSYLEKSFVLDFDSPLQHAPDALMKSGTQIFHNIASDLWHLILSANLSSSVLVFPKDVGVSDFDRSWIAFDFFAQSWSLFSSTQPLKLRSNIIPPWNNRSDCNLAPCNQTIDFDYHVIAPVAGKWALVGEIDKYVPMSKARFSVDELSDSFIRARVTLARGEAINVVVINIASGTKSIIKCAGKTLMKFVCDENKCQCS